MKVIDLVFGKRITGSFYHIQGTYVKRKIFSGDIIDAANTAIDEILIENNLPDEVITVLNNLKIQLSTLKDLEGNDTREIVKAINESFATLSYLEYEFLAIVRHDFEVESELDIELPLNDRSYVLTKALTGESYYGIDAFSSGIGNSYEEAVNVNINSMVMDYLEGDRIKIDDENESLMNLSSIVEEYRELSEHGETNYMDTTKVLNMLEKIGYKFYLVYNMDSEGAIG